MGGANNKGCVFSINSNGSNYQDLFNFNGSNGSGPLNDLTLSRNVLYGMTFQGGVADSGCIFSINTNGSGYKDMFDFDGANGSLPSGGLVILGDKLYGMTSNGGANNNGVIFSYSDTNINTSISEFNPFVENIQLFPNPNKGDFNIYLKNNIGDQLMQVFDLTGQRIFQTELNSIYANISMDNQPAGIYFYKIFSGSGEAIASGKLIIQ